MFTGLISGLGKVVRWDASRLVIEMPFRRLQMGESIAIDGVCLTVASHSGSRASFDIGNETRRATSLAERTSGDRVNVERALRVGDSVGGHFVTGHVDDIGTIQSVRQERHNWEFQIKIPKPLLPYVVPKGSVAIDGISLTVVSLKGSFMKTMIVPHTLSHTTLGTRKAGARVNIETDVLAKYASGRNKPGNARLDKTFVRTLLRFTH